MPILMRVRRISMPSTRVISGRRIPTFIWVPPEEGAIYKIEIEKSDGTKYDVTDIIHSGEYTDGVTETIGNFDIVIDNSNQEYTNEFSIYDEVNIYLDYASTATTLQFKGKIEKISKQEHTLRLTGRSMAVRTIGIFVTKSYTNEYTNVIIQDLIDNYATFITKSNIDTDTATDVQVTVNWSKKSFWECILELCQRSGREAYIDSDSDFNYFVSGSRDNLGDAIVHEQNLIQTGDFAPDATVLRNKVTVQGAEVEGQQVIWSVTDSSSSIPDIKEEVIKDSNILTPEQAKTRAEYELSVRKDPPIIGDIMSLGLPTLKPGERLRISDPMNGLTPQYYQIQKFTHKFSNDEPFQTQVTVFKEINTVPKILKGRIEFEQTSIDKTNPNEMEYSYLWTFQSDSGSHSNTQIIDSFLTCTSTSGTWTSEAVTAEQTTEAIELRAQGEDLVNITYEVSVDGGVNFSSVSSLNTQVNASGTNLSVKVNLNSENARLDSLSLLWK